MASKIDATVPADNVKVDKALLRQNNATAKEEITALQTKTSQAGRLAYDDTYFDNL
jgi:Ca2+-dependent lipid-binding protein